MYILNQQVFHTEHSLLISVWHKALMSYLRFNVDLLGCLLIEPFHVDLAVEVSDVADDGVIFHLLKVPVGEKNTHQHLMSSVYSIYTTRILFAFISS